MECIAWFLENFGFAMLLLAVIIIVFQRFISPLPLAEIVYRWIALFPLGFTGIYTFVIHAFYPNISAQNIGWVSSPFQYEVAIADLTIGVLGILSFKASAGFRLATVIAAMCWLWGDAIGHVRQMLINQNFAPGNAGSWFWMDVFIPLILLVSIISLRRRAQS